MVSVKSFIEMFWAMSNRSRVMYALSTVTSDCSSR